MEVTEAGMMMEVIAACWNATRPMVKSPLPAAKMTDVRLKHALNANSPMEVTDAGMVMEVIPVFSNAPSPMVSSTLPVAKVTDAMLVTFLNA